MNDPPNEHYWERVAEYIDSRDLHHLRREWWTGDDETFVRIAIHVASCILCLRRRLDLLQAWSVSDRPTEEP